jgi:hypothetical protein
MPHLLRAARRPTGLAAFTSRNKSLRSKTALRSFLYPKLFCLASGRSASTGLAAFTSCNKPLRSKTA